MKTVITLRDGRREYISSDRDFIDLIDRELGLEAREAVQDIYDDNEIMVEEVIGAMSYHIGQLLEQMRKELNGYLNHFPRDSQKVFNALDKTYEIEKYIDEFSK